MAIIDPSVARYVDAYVVGWARSRGAPCPQSVEHGWYVPTGTPTEPERYVLTAGTAEIVCQIRNGMPKPGSCLKFAGAREDWLFLVDSEWEENPIGWFMTCDINTIGADRSATPSLGQVTQATVRDDVALIEVQHKEKVIASGRAGLAGSWVVPDRVRTSAAHRRRGLGRFVMHSLLSLGHEAGAQRAVLDASTDGRQLYLALGWKTVAGQFGISRSPARDNPESASPKPASPTTLADSQLSTITPVEP